MIEQDEKPRFLKTWTNVYAMVISALVATIVSLYLFTNYFK